MVDVLLADYPKFEKLAEETEQMRCKVDEIYKTDGNGAFIMMIDIDNNMLELLNYHIQLSAACLKETKEWRMKPQIKKCKLYGYVEVDFDCAGCTACKHGSK